MAGDKLSLEEIARITEETVGITPSELLCEEIQRWLGQATAEQWEAVLKRAKRRILGAGLLPQLARDVATEHDLITHCRTAREQR